MSETRLLERLVAERDIQQIVLRYAHGIDQLDFEMVRACFHPDAKIVYGGLADGVRDEALAWLEEMLPSLAGSSHFFGAPRIELDLDAGTAVAETYSLNTTRQTPDAEGRTFATYTSARYIDRFERRDTEWRIAHRELVRDWTQRLLEVSDPGLPTATRSQTS